MVSNSDTLEIAKNVVFLTAVFSLFFNVILILLIVFKSHKQFGTYKYLMAFIAVSEIAMALVEAVLVPIHYSHGSAVAIMTFVSNTPFSPKIASIFLLITLGLFGACLANFAVHFIYRYLTVSGSPLIGSFQSWKLVFWTLLPICSGMAWSVTAYFLCSPSQEVNELLRKGVLSDFGEDIESFEYRLFYLYKRLNNGDVSFNLGSLAALGIYSFTVAFSLFIILFFGFKCYRHIRNLKSQSARVSCQLTAIQHQLFNALVVQTLIPMLLVHLPTFTLFVLAFFETDVGKQVSLASMSIAIYSIIGPLPNFFIIKPFRTALSNYLRFWKRKKDDNAIKRRTAFHPRVS